MDAWTRIKDQLDCECCVVEKATEVLDARVLCKECYDKFAEALHKAFKPGNWEKKDGE